MFRSRQLSKRNAKVVGIVKSVEEIFVERMDILESWEAIEDETKFLAEGLLCEFDLSCIKICRHSVSISFTPVWYRDSFLLRILLMLKPARICVGSLL